MAGFDAVELCEDAPSVGLVVEVGKQVEGLGDPAEFGAGTARWGWAGRRLAGRGGSGRALWDAGCAPSGRRMSRAGARRSDCIQPDPTDAVLFVTVTLRNVAGRRPSAWPSSSCMCRADGLTGLPGGVTVAVRGRGVKAAALQLPFSVTVPDSGFVQHASSPRVPGFNFLTAAKMRHEPSLLAQDRIGEPTVRAPLHGGFR